MLWKPLAIFSRIFSISLVESRTDTDPLRFGFQFLSNATTTGSSTMLRYTLKSTSGRT